MISRLRYGDGRVQGSVRILALSRPSATSDSWIWIVARRPADHDTINQVANVSLRSSVVRGQLAEGLRHASFDIGGRNARDRSCFAHIALQSRLRYIIAPALGPLPRPGRAHPVAAIVIELACEQRIGRLARSLSRRSAEMIAQDLLDLVPQV
jgi:hypothetical protein